MAAFCVCKNGFLRLCLVKFNNERAFDSENQKNYLLLQDLICIYMPITHMCI